MRINYQGERKYYRIFLLVLFLTFTLITLGLITFSYADDDDDGGESKVTEAFNSYKGESEYEHEILGKFNEDFPTGREDSFRYLFSRVFSPGYVNDVSSGVPAKGSDKSVLYGTKGNYKLCSTSAKNNLIGHNCDIPNFSAQLLQSFYRVFEPGGIINAERSAAKSTLGVPMGIPGGKVPVSESARTSKYTALELFGYGLKFTDYRGEWDDIIPSTRARLLANFGLMDSINMTGTSIWNGTKAGIGSYIKNVSWNPLSWFTSVFTAWQTGTSATFLTVVDSSEMNIATSRAWVRSGSSVGNTFYNVKVLSDKEILESANLRIASKFSNLLNAAAMKDPGLNEVLELQAAPVFTYDPNRETEASKKRRAAAKSQNKSIDKYNSSLPEGAPESDRKDRVEIPEKEIMSEEDQFKEWIDTDSRVKRGESKGFGCSSSSNYAEFESCWATSWASYSEREFDAKSSIVAPLIDKIRKDLLKDDPYADPARAISHYVCADEDGNAKLDENGNYSYLYLRENTKTEEFINPSCSLVRPAIEGGYFGTGNRTAVTDTRHKDYVSHEKKTGSIANLAFSLSKVMAKVTNEFINFGFTPLAKKLGLDVIVEETINSMKRTLFYPLLGLVVSLSAFYMILNLLKTFSLVKTVKSLFMMMVVLLVSMVVLNHPRELINFVDQAPEKAESFLTDLILNRENSPSLCTAGGKGEKNGLRSAQCNVWSSLVLTPWVYGQFGTSLDNLNASALENTNGDLVGTADVNMGGGVVEHNWALYQLKETTSGTITTEDPSSPVGTVSPNLYKIVDLQAGPNLGEGRDSRYFDSWTGKADSRTYVAVLSAILSVLTFLVVPSLLIAKIEMSFLSTLLLIGLPVVLLVGLFPGGQVKLKKYAGTLLSLMAKRLILTLLISITLLLVGGAIPTALYSYSYVFIFSFVVFLAIRTYKAEVLEMFGVGPDQTIDTPIFGGSLQEIEESISSYIPTPIKNKFSAAKQRTTGRIAGGVGGALSGGAFVLKNLSRGKLPEFSNSTPKAPLLNIVEGIRESAKSGATRESEQLESRELNRIFRVSPDFVTKKNAVDKVLHSEFTEDLVSNDMADSGSSAYRDMTKGRAYRYARNDLHEKDLDASVQRQLRKAGKQTSKAMALRVSEKENEKEKATELLAKSKEGTEKSSKRMDEKVEKRVKRDSIRHPLNSQRRAVIEENRKPIAITPKEYADWHRRGVGSEEPKVIERVSKVNADLVRNEESQLFKEEAKGRYRATADLNTLNKIQRHKSVTLTNSTKEKATKEREELKKVNEVEELKGAEKGEELKEIEINEVKELKVKGPLSLNSQVRVGRKVASFDFNLKPIKGKDKVEEPLLDKGEVMDNEEKREGEDD